jgi:outer membrane receptor protein involved in Fe transport
MSRLFALFVTAIGIAVAQVDTGTISGLVRDASGGGIPGAPVILRDQSTGLATEIASNPAGLYVSPPLRAGTYVVEVRANGFEAAAKRVQLDVSQRFEVDFDLVVGAVSSTVAVKDVAGTLQTESATLSNLRSEQAVKDLPLNSRNFAQLITLAAGAMPAQSQTTGSPITMKRGAVGASINGTRLEENNFLVDGILNNENHNGLGILIFPIIDAIEEFRVEASVANAQFGRGGGGTINLTYKSGGKDYHGGLFEFLRNSDLDAKNYFDSKTAPIPEFRLNQFGGFIGGRVDPRSKDAKTFFFFDYQGQRVRQGQTYLNSVPIAAFRSGDFSAAPQLIFDPLMQTQNAQGQFVRVQFPGNVIPASRLDTVGKNLMNLYPDPNRPGLVNNYLYNPVRITSANDWDLKFDRRFSDNDAAWARYSSSKNDLTEPSFLPAPAVGNGPSVPGLNDQPVKQVVLSETHILSATSFNEARFGFTRLNLRAFPLNFGHDISQQAGIPGSNVAGDVLTSGLANISVSGLTGLGDAGFAPAVIVSENYQWNDNFTKIKGKHSLKFGVEARRLHYNAVQSNTPRGAMAFNAFYTTNPASPNGTGLGAAELLLGRPASGNIAYIAGTRGLRRSELAFYTQDDVKIASRLTLNLGLRWEDYIGWPWTEVDNRMYDFVPATQTIAQVGANGIPRSGVNGNNHNFGPRAGLAWQPFDRTVVRVAYGIFYSAPQLDVTRNLVANPPEGISTSFTNNQFDFVNARPASAGFIRPSVGSLTNAALNYMDPNSAAPYTQQWNVSLQRQLPLSLGLTVAYVGTKGTHLEARPDINQPVPGTTPIPSRRPYPLFQGILTSENVDNSIYNGLQLTLERRLAKSVSMLVTYTYSHAIDVASADFGAWMNAYNRNQDRGNADFDVRRRFVASWTWALPFHSAGRVRLLVDGWQLNGILSLYDGLPFTVNSSTNTLNTGSSTRASILPGANGALPVDQRTLAEWFNIAAFTAPGPQQFGNTGRNILRGPGTAQADLSLFKDFFLSADQGRRLQFRAESFNVSNTPQFNNPASSIGSAGAGTITAAGAPLTFQRTSREIQLALKLYF